MRENRRAVFVKTQALSRILLLISMSKPGAISLKAMGTTQAWTRWSQKDQAFYSVTQALHQIEDLWIFSKCRYFLILVRSNLSTSFMIKKTWHLASCLRNLCLIRGHNNFLSSRSFILMSFTFRSEIHFQLIFVDGARYVLKFTFFLLYIQFVDKTIFFFIWKV